MNNEERDLITRFIQRVGGAQQGGFAQGTPSQGAPGQGAPGQGSAPALPPIDREADALIAELFARFPEARYRITQMAFVGEHALIEAQNRIQRLEWEVQQARQQAQAAPQQPQQPSPWGAAAQPPQQQESRGFFGNLFGGRARLRRRSNSISRRPRSSRNTPRRRRSIRRGTIPGCCSRAARASSAAR